MNTLNDSQQVFMLFFAILWGTVANSQPRWKAFNGLALWDFPIARRRLALSMLFLNVLPLIYFGFALFVLSRNSSQLASSSLLRTWSIVLHSVVPAFATFGFYRLWLGCVEMRPHWFFEKDGENIPLKYQHVEPVYGKPASEGCPVVDLNPVTGKRNAVSAVGYIVIAGAALFVP